MTKSALSIEQNLERLAEAQERTATALEAILEHIANFKIEKVGELLLAGSTLITGTAHEVKVVETAAEPAKEEPAAEETQEGGDDAGDPLSDTEEDPLGGGELVGVRQAGRRIGRRVAGDMPGGLDRLAQRRLGKIGGRGRTPALAGIDGQVK